MTVFEVRCPGCGVDAARLPPCWVCGHRWGCCPCVHADERKPMSEHTPDLLADGLDLMGAPKLAAERRARIADNPPAEAVVRKVGNFDDVTDQHGVFLYETTGGRGDPPTDSRYRVSASDGAVEWADDLAAALTIYATYCDSFADAYAGTDPEQTSAAVIEHWTREYRSAAFEARVDAANLLRGEPALTAEDRISVRTDFWRAGFRRADAASGEQWVKPGCTITVSWTPLDAGG